MTLCCVSKRGVTDQIGGFVDSGHTDWVDDCRVEGGPRFSARPGRDAKRRAGPNVNRQMLRIGIASTAFLCVPVFAVGSANAALSECGAGIALPVPAGASGLADPQFSPSSARSGALPLTLSAGRYAVSAGSAGSLSDASDGNQSWFAVFHGPDGVTEVGRTAIVSDLETGTESHVEKLTDLQLRGEARSVTYVHSSGRGRVDHPRRSDCSCRTRGWGGRRCWPRDRRGDG